MLLRFGVTNFRSLRERQELSFVASSLDDDASAIIETRHVPGNKLLPVIAVYGPNASGKSNIVAAIQWMCSAVLHSHSGGEPGGGVPVQPFALESAPAAAPSHCDIDFVIDDVRYHYGFTATKAAFEAEWLYSYPNDRKQVLFERTGMAFTFGRSLKGRNQTIAGLTRPNSLLLSAAAQNGHEELTKLTRFFRQIVLGELPDHEIANALPYPTVDRRIVNFLKAAGTGVVNYNVRDIPFDENQNPVLARFRSVIVEEFKQASFKFPENVKELQLAHTGVDGFTAYFNLEQESAGTRRLLRILVPTFLALDTGSIVVIDELDASLHTKACELVLALFSSRTTNPNGAQLVLTTHDTNLLQSAHLRRDQVWLTEKDGNGATNLYPLTDFRTRKADNLERGYLEGRYGSVPFSGNARDIILAM